MDYDVFISHAFEDKESFVEPLANTLQEANLRVWYDSFELKLGDSLREKIDYGLANSQYGVVILSKHFFAKRWPQDELDGLVARQNSEGKKVILPIWHKVGYDEVKKFSPTLAGKMAVRSEKGVEAVAAQILSVVNEDISSRPASVFQMGKEIGLREKCLELIRQENLIEWRSLVEQLSEGITSKLLEWKHIGEKAVEKGLLSQPANIDLWREAVYEAIRISIPGAIPILTAIQAGNEDYWQESTNFIRRCVLLEGDMGGGTNLVRKIGDTILYVVGSLGFGLISKTKQLGLVKKWSKMVLPLGRNEGEVKWGECLEVNYWCTKITGEHKNPFAYLDELSQVEDINHIIGDADTSKKYLFSGNLLQSMLEFACDAKNPDFMEQIQAEHWRPYIMPIWCLMAPDDFRKEVWRLFSSREEVLKFCDIRREFHPYVQIWPMWKAWKSKCAAFMSNGFRYEVFEARFLYLPGEPKDQ